MTTNTLGEFSDGEDDFVFEIDENLWKKSDPEAWEWSDPEADDIIRNINEEEILARVYGNDDAVIRNGNEEEILTGEWSDPEADDLIRNIDENEVLRQLNQDENLWERSDPEAWEWSDPETDDLIRNIDENEVLRQLNQPSNTLGEFSDGEEDDIIQNADENEVQMGRGEKRKSADETESEDEQHEGQYYYTLESRRKYHSKKFGMTATDHRVRFNNVLADRDLLESYESTLKIFHYLLEEVTEGMAPNDQVRFILRSEQLDTPISLPFMTVEQLNAERVYSELERVIQSNQDFRLNDTVTIDINHVKTPQGSGKSRVKRITLNIREYLNNKKSIVRINNTDDLCLARALVVSIARIEKDPKYVQIRQSNKSVQRERAFDLHEAANVPLGPCGLNEVALFQQYLINYQIIVVSGDHDNSIIYPPQPSGTDEKPTISLYFQNNHFDVITKLPGFVNRSYFCYRCLKAYSNTTDHLCAAMRSSCRGFGCVFEGFGIVCSECDRVFKNQTCYDRHKTEPINGGGRTVCQTIGRCEKCWKTMDVRKIRDGGHICGKKCRTCGVILNQEDTHHKCYIQQLEQDEDSGYNQLLFFDFEATQEHGTHCPNLCVVHDEEREVALFQGKDTVKDFCQWLLTPEHKDCIVVAHNF